MSSARLISILFLATGAVAAAPDLRAQTPLTRSGLSLFSDFGASSSAARVFTGNFGGYGVSLASDAGSAFLPGPRLGGRAEGGVSLIGAYTINQFRVAVDIRRDPLDLDRRRSSTEFGFGFAGSIGPSLSVGAGPTIGFGEVTPARSPLRASGDGARTVGLSGSATLSLSDNWALTGVLGYRSRTDGAKDDSFFSVFGLGYRF